MTNPTDWVRRTIIVPASYAPLARSLAAGIAGSSGTGMFTVGLSASGSAPATHFISSGNVFQQFADMMIDPAAIAAASQGQVTLAQAQALVSNSTVRGAPQPAGETPLATDPFEVVAELGLQFVRAAL